jgi:chromate transport protein ChrA
MLLVASLCDFIAIGRGGAPNASSDMLARHLHTCRHQSKREGIMSGVKILAIILIIAGVIGLAYQQFSFTRETAQAKIGPVELSVREKQTVNVPMWLSIGALGIGVVLLVTGRGKK